MTDVEALKVRRLIEKLKKAEAAGISLTKFMQHIDDDLSGVAHKYLNQYFKNWRFFTGALN